MTNAINGFRSSVTIAAYGNKNMKAIRKESNLVYDKHQQSTRRRKVGIVGEMIIERNRNSRNNC